MNLEQGKDVLWTTGSGRRWRHVTPPVHLAATCAHYEHPPSTSLLMPSSDLENLPDTGPPTQLLPVWLRALSPDCLGQFQFAPIVPGQLLKDPPSLAKLSQLEQ